METMAGFRRKHTGSGLFLQVDEKQEKRRPADKVKIIVTPDKSGMRDQIISTNNANFLNIFPKSGLLR